MLCRFLFGAMLLAACALAGCEKVDFDASGETTPGTPPASGEISDTLTVAQALYLAANAGNEELSAINAVGIKGYIVGAIPGTSLSNSVFSPPYNSNSNILIADNVDETDAAACMPVRLVKDTPFRAELNLEDNPANKGRLILVSGTVARYFRTYGIYDLDGYAWCDVAVRDTVFDRPGWDNPHVDYDSELVEGGRSVRP